MSGLMKHSICAGLVAFGMTYLIGLAAQKDAVTEFEKKLSDALKPDEDEIEEEEKAEETAEPAAESESEEEDNSDDSDDDDLF